jgi:hypothetical protein
MKKYIVFVVNDDNSKTPVAEFETNDLAIDYADKNLLSGNRYSIEEKSDFGSTVLI